MSTVVMSIAGQTLGPNFPLVAQAFEYVRQDEQGPAYRKVSISLTGFVLGNNGDEVRDAYDPILAVLATDRVDFLFTIASGGDSPVTVQNRKVYIQSYTEPSEWKEYDGPYEINLYYFEPITQDMDISASFDGYTFPRLPKWGREFSANRESVRDETHNGTSVTVTLEGFLSADTEAHLATMIAAMDAVMVPALSAAGLKTLVYGSFSHSCKLMKYRCDPVVPITQAYYSMEFAYDIGTIVELKASRQISRIHYNPIIKDLPACNTRSIRLGNQSGQEITYNISVTSANLTVARQQLAIEASARIIGGGIEMPGGSQTENENTCTAAVTITKFYNVPQIANLAST